MKKAEALRAHLTNSVPYLRLEPQNLHVYIERGSIGCRLGGGISYDYHYEINLVVIDFTDHVDTLMIPLLAWIATNEPGLMQAPATLDQVLRFEAEIIDNNRADISITVPVSERVIVTKIGDTYTATHADEPDLADLGGLSGWQLFINGIEVIVE